MPLAFSVDEYRERAKKVRQAMAEKGVDVLLVADIANQLWLTGCEGWSFYVPQLVILPIADEEPMWIGRAMDAPGARMTGCDMEPECVHAVPERYVQRADRHPCDHIGEFLQAAVTRRAASATSRMPITSPRAPSSACALRCLMPGSSTAT